MRNGRRLLAISAACLAVFIASPLVATTQTVAGPPPFADSSPFNSAIRNNPVLDPASGPMIRYASRRGQLFANLYEFGIPIYVASASTPRHPVTCTMEGAWGSCPLSRTPMPIPDGARPNTGSDGVLTVIDTSTNTVGEYWQARRTGGRWSASWGAVNSLSGSGWGGASTGAGASRLAGVVRVAEIQSGVIDHALVLQSDNVCARVFRSPALKTDGNSTRPDCIPEGARLQLDPAVNVSALPGLTPGERTVARAMQVYGGYLIDRGGTSLSASFELASDGSGVSPGSAYQKAGMNHDYFGLPGVPWNRLRVLSS